MRNRKWLVLIGLAFLAMIAAACVQPLVTLRAPQSTPTAASVAVSPARQSIVTATVVPTRTKLALAATATRQPASATATATKTLPTPTPTLRRAQPAARPTATPAWPQALVITEADIEAGASGNTVPGLQVEGLDVQLGDGTMTVSFSRLRYGIVSLRNVTIQGHFTVANGDVTFVADRIQPRNLATSTIPGFVNQSLDQYLAGWYVEELQIEPGQLVASVRPL